MFYMILRPTWPESATDQYANQVDCSTWYTEVTRQMWTLRCFNTCVHRCSLSWVELSWVGSTTSWHQSDADQDGALRSKRLPCPNCKNCLCYRWPYDRSPNCHQLLICTMNTLDYQRLPYCRQSSQICCCCCCDKVSTLCHSQSPH